MLPDRFVSAHVLADMPADTPIAVALSGGADSVALLHMLKKSTDAPLCAVHVHHGIRGAEADRDAAFCASLCDAMDVPLTVIRLDVPALAKQTGKGLETAARDARYEALERFLDERHIRLLATAHHADDQLETLLQHLLRGSGLRGLCGIPASRPLGAATVVRPLLHLSKEEILSYCETSSLHFVTDSTNEEPCCPRNRLRLAVLPVLRELWPSGAVCAARCAASLAEDEQLLQSMADEFLAAEGSTPHVKALCALPRPILARVLHAMLPTPPEAVHLDAVAALIRDARPHASLSLPRATVCVENGRLVVQTQREQDVPAYEIALDKGLTAFPCGIAILGDATPDKEAIAAYRHRAIIRFSSAAARGTLTLRSRRAGDRILSGGVHKTVRKLPVMTAFTPSERARMPLLCDEDGILAVPNGPVRDGAAKKPDTAVLLFFN